MSLTVTIIAKLSRVDSDMARRALNTASAFDEPDATPPEEFTWGAGARCYALASIAVNRPQLFWGGGARDNRDPASCRREADPWLAGSDRT